MANPAEVATQIRFALSQMPVENAHHSFEQLCRHLTQQFICSNVLPATGPVSAGGDQGRDFETFRTYLRDELGSTGAFLGLVSEGTIAFVCTIQADGVTGKLRSDIETVCSSGHPVHEIRAFTLASVPVGKRHALESEVQETYNVRLEFHDAESIADLLARPEGFWIAEHFLSLPAEIRPIASSDDEDLPDAYVARRRKWRDERALYPTLGSFLDLRGGLRESMYRESAHNDLPFWLSLMREFLAICGLPSHIQQRARYELAVVTLRGTGDLRPVDDVVRVYLDESLQEREPAYLEDASSLLMYAKSAARRGVTTIRAAELEDWSVELAGHIEERIPDETPHRRASLLCSLGFLGLHEALRDDQLPDSPVCDTGSEGIDTIAPPWASLDSTLPGDYVCRDAPRTLSAWTQLVEGLDETPLFPLETLAALLQLLLPLWSTQPEWRKLLDLVDEEIGSREGRSAIAERARARSIALMNEGRNLEALEELHRARVEWWSGDTVRGSVLASLVIAHVYQKLRLYTAAKAYALAVASIAISDDDLADLASPGLLMAALSEFLSGVWYGAAKMYGLGLSAQYQMDSSGIDLPDDDLTDGAILHLTYISRCAPRVDPALQIAVQEIVDRSGFGDLIDGVIDQVSDSDEWSWDSFGEGNLSDSPFSDLGQIRRIRFSALGTNWSVVTANDNDSVGVAERFAAGVQTVLAALAKEDLCLVPTEITVRIEAIQETDSELPEHAEVLPSNEGREWRVRLVSTGLSSSTSRERINSELTTVLTTILREASLLPTNDFLAVMQRAFERGLGHKLSAAVQMEELVAMFSANHDNECALRSFEVPWTGLEGTFASSEELCWQKGPGPTYSSEKARQFLQTRYEALAQSVRITAVVLHRSEEFRTTLQALREDGWLDWHILTAISNIAMNYRFPLSAMPPTEEYLREMYRSASSPESATAPPVPISQFTPERMQTMRQAAMMSLLNNWELECHQRTPDIRAIEGLLAARYGYWDEDVPHEDPFPEADDSGA